MTASAIKEGLLARPITPIDWHFCADWNCVGTALYDWQTLVASMIALFAAIWAGRIVKKQIKLSETQEDVRRRQRFRAARSTLPLSLSVMGSYASEMAMRLSIHQRRVEGEKLAGLLLETVPPPDAAIEALERMVEASDIESVNILIRKMLSQVQLVQALSDSLARPNFGRFGLFVGNHDPIILRCVIIHAIAGNLLQFARFEQDDLNEEIDWADVESSLLILQLYEEHHSLLFSLFRNMREGGRSPDDF